MNIELEYEKKFNISNTVNKETTITMFRYVFNFFFCLIFMSNNVYSAVKVVQCEDEQGNKSFHSSCPPGHIQVGEKTLKTSIGTPAKKNPANIEALVYIGTNDCFACEAVQEYLKTRGIKLTVKDATSDVEIQKELNELVGKLTVPATKIGDKVITGYKRNELKAALETMGYEEEKSE